MATTKKSIRITNEMATNAAQEMAAKVYSEKIKEAREELRKEGEKLIKKYIPSPVLSVVNEYIDFFSTARHVNFYDDTMGKYSAASITVGINFDISYGSSYICISKDDMRNISKFYVRVEDLQNKARDFENEIYKALKSLGTSKKVEENLPEALEYLNIPEEKALPMPIYQNIRNLLQQAK